MWGPIVTKFITVLYVQTVQSNVIPGGASGVMTDCSPAPVEEVIEYETRPVDGLAEGSIYSGYPRPESESAWKSLMDGKYRPNVCLAETKRVAPNVLYGHQHQTVPR